MRFQDRIEAGRTLAELLASMDLHDPVVLALPRGGVPVAVQVGARLGAPVDVFVARKIGYPGHEEFGIGAIAEGSDEVLVGEAAERLGLDRWLVAELAPRERLEVQRRVLAYRGGRQLPELTGRDVVLVDDGLATGVTAEAALEALRSRQPRRLVLAVPVCAGDTARRLRDIADDVVCASAQENLGAVGVWYTDFHPVTDQEVVGLLSDASRPAGKRE
ncbi:MAG: phosphoribosyltransferase [Catenulispora sp.]|nr:phosphoribosyltransferase [Catenulispora sp.]